MNATLSKALEAHGGLANWNKFKELKLTAKNDGVIWHVKQQSEYTNNPVKLTFDLKKQVTKHTNFIESGLQTDVTPNLVVIKNAKGDIINQLENPRKSFTDHTFETQWDKLQLAYFTGYAMWSYLNAPFLFAETDFIVEDIPSWFENGVEWKGIAVTFPERLAYHSKKQNFYFDPEGLLRRHDYDVDIVPGARGAHYMTEYVEVDGIKFPTHHLVRIPGEDNIPLENPIVVDVKISDIELA